LVGSAASLAFVTTGLITGINTVSGSNWLYFSPQTLLQEPRIAGSRAWRLVLAAGLVLGAAWYRSTAVGGMPEVTAVAPWQLSVGGFIAGFGARLGNGCTSGQGICSLAASQAPSLAAVLTCMAPAIVTANLVAMPGGSR
jgi:uncharacterized membrane protein YedE/YeeE